MPRDNKKRGRRDDQRKRKRDRSDVDSVSKRRKEHADLNDEPAADVDVPPLDAPGDGVHRPEAAPFYGMLDSDEQEYFRHADELLELNQFDDPEERDRFLASVYKEADGKELKIANSQSCSRLMERLILLSSPKQLKDLFQKFSGQYVYSLRSPLRTDLPASSTSSSTASHPIAARPSSYTPHQSSHTSLPNPSCTLCPRLTPTKSL